MKQEKHEHEIEHEHSHINAHEHRSGYNHNHDHAHDNGHVHGHNHDISGISGKRIFFVVMLNFVITVAEVVGGLVSGSLSLISDALHNFSDAVSFVISYFAIKIAEKSKDKKRTYGYKRSTILAALVNSSVLIIISLFLFKEAYGKFINPQEIKGGIVIWVALIGLVANFVGMILLKKSSDGDMNLKSSYLHLLSDTLSSVGVIIAGILIYFFKMYWVDPVLTILIGLYIIKESIEILKKAIQILMQAVPDYIIIDEIVEELHKIKNVVRVHHVHAWCLDENNINFEAHINIEDMLVSETKELLKEIEMELFEHGITHTTIQFEFGGCEDVGILEK